MVNGLVAENMDLKSRISAIERKFGDMEKTVQEMRKAQIDGTRTFNLGSLLAMNLVWTPRVYSYLDLIARFSNQMHV